VGRLSGKKPGDPGGKPGLLVGEKPTAFSGVSASDGGGSPDAWGGSTGKVRMVREEE